MSYNFLIDSYAWIEYFRGTKKGDFVKEFIEKEFSATSSLTIAELTDKYLREDMPNLDKDLEFIHTKTKIIDLTSEIAADAGKINFENKKKIKNWGMADSIILATAQKLNAKIITGDEHFRNFDSVML